MPLVNIIGVNNFGRSIILGFALLNDETGASHNWLFSNLKLIWKKDPKYFISDECSEIILGKDFSSSTNYLFFRN